MTALISATVLGFGFWFIAALVCSFHDCLVAHYNRCHKAIPTVAQLEQAIAELDGLVPLAPLVDYSAKTAVELRKVCAELGIQWRNAHGVGKHLRKDEMLALLG